MYNPNQVESQVAKLPLMLSSLISIFVVPFLFGKEFFSMLNTFASDYCNLDSITVTFSVPENGWLGQLSRDLRFLYPIHYLEIFKAKPTIFNGCRQIYLNWSKPKIKPGERALNYRLLETKSEYLYLFQ